MLIKHTKTIHGVEVNAKISVQSKRIRVFLYIRVYGGKFELYSYSRGEGVTAVRDILDFVYHICEERGLEQFADELDGVTIKELTDANRTGISTG